MRIATTLAPLAVAAVLVATLAACGGSDGPTAPEAQARQAPAAVAASPAPAPSRPTYPACAGAFVVGQVPALDARQPVCTDPAGTSVALGALACADGSALVTVDSPAGWYVTGQAFQAGAAESDPAYSSAYAKCQG